MITKDKLPDLLKAIGFQQRGNTYEKSIGSTKLEVNFTKGEITYPDGLTVNQKNNLQSELQRKFRRSRMRPSPTRKGLQTRTHRTRTYLEVGARPQRWSPQPPPASRRSCRAICEEIAMTNAPIAHQHHATFEGIRQQDEMDEEFWSARDLAPLLEYQDWRNFMQVVDKARVACEQAGNPTVDHFGDTTKMVSIGSGAKRKLPDIRLSRYACYLIVQNGDPSKPVIANGQTYFAMQTRRQELANDSAFGLLSENEKRLAIRNELAQHNKYLAAAASDAGVDSGKDFAIFQDHGYRGLYGGLGAKAIHAQKGLKKSQKIIDHMGSTELAANLFRATQAEEKLRRDGVQGKQQANKTHFEVGQKVRETIRDLGGTMPENLPTPAQGIKQLESTQQKIGNKKQP